MDKNKNVSPLVAVLVLGGFFLAVVLIIVIGGSSAKNTSSDNSLPQSSSQEQPKGLSTGEKGLLRVSGQTEVLVASSKESLDKITHAAVIKDSLGIAQMVLAGEAFLVDAETKVLVINTSFAAREVRILGGKKFGSSGWVPFEFVVSANPEPQFTTHTLTEVECNKVLDEILAVVNNKPVEKSQLSKNLIEQYALDAGIPIKNPSGNTTRYILPGIDKEVSCGKVLNGVLMVIVEGTKRSL